MKIGWRSLRVLVGTSVGLLGVLSMGATTARASWQGFDWPGFNWQLTAEPWTYVGAAGDCGGVGSDPFDLGIPYAAGSRIVTSEWLDGIGLPDRDTLLNSSQAPYAATPGNDPFNNPNKRNHRQGLLLSKNGPTEDCSSAGATIDGIRNHLVTAGETIGFDIRNGLHCGAGAVRFNLVTVNPATKVETFHFVGGCANGVQTPALQDPTSWTTVRFDLTNPAHAFPVVAVGDRIKSLEIMFDEGTTSQYLPPTFVLPGAGVAIIDNIYVDGRVVREDRDDRHFRLDGDHDRDHHDRGRWDRDDR